MRIFPPTKQPVKVPTVHLAGGPKPSSCFFFFNWKGKACFDGGKQLWEQERRNLNFETRLRLGSGSSERHPSAFAPTCELSLFFLGIRATRVGSPWRTGRGPLSSCRRLPTGISRPRWVWGFAAGGQWAASLLPRPPRARGPAAPVLWVFQLHPRFGSRLRSGERSLVLCSSRLAEPRPDGEPRPGN